MGCNRSRQALPKLLRSGWSDRQAELSADRQRQRLLRMALALWPEQRRVWQSNYWTTCMAAAVQTLRRSKPRALRRLPRANLAALTAFARFRLLNHHCAFGQHQLLHQGAGSNRNGAKTASLLFDQV